MEVIDKSVIRRLKIQAPKPFEAGRRMGIKKVAEDMSVVFITTQGAAKQAEEIYKVLQFWQGKLTEWGI